MITRSKWLPWVLIGAVGCAGAAAGLWWQRRAPPPPELATGEILEPRPEVPDFTLIDHAGRAFTRANLRGAWSMLFFGYTNCPDVCPTTLATLAGMQKRLRAAAVTPLPRVVFISVDAERDTPAQLARYVPYFDSGFVGVTAASQQDIENFTAAMHVPVIITRVAGGAYSVDHSAAIFVVAPDATLAALLNGPFSAQTLASDWRLITDRQL